MRNKIAIIGDKDSVLAFRAVGAEVFDATTKEQAQHLLKTLAEDDFAVILITENLAEQTFETLEKLKKRAYPIVVPIPDATGTNGFGIRGIKKDIEKAVGTDILFKEENNGR